MGYQALLFCSDEKTARTVTQVLSELEFSVESSPEPFAAVKKLMAEHFDAVVVDCDNEQNATLLFKSARNSASNQTSLAVAVVEGQVGVAKAFRIGANLVLTKPINVEQAKGTLRVARGLLRKGDPAKTAAAAGTQTPTKSTAPAAPARPVSQSATPAVQRPGASAPVVKPAAPVSRPAQAVAASQTAAPGTSTPEAAKPVKAPISSSFAASAAPAISSLISGSGAASAAAPARAAQEPEFEQSGTPNTSSDAPKAAAGTVDLDDTASRSSESSAPAPSFTFGGANVPAESAGGGSKKAFVGVAAAVLVGAGLYFGWTQFHGKSTAPSSSVQPPVASSTVTPQATQPSKPQPPLSSAPVPSSPASSPNNQATAPSSSVVQQPDSAEEEADSPRQNPEKATGPVKNSTKPASTGSTAATKPAAETKPSPQPMMVKNGAAARAQKQASSEVSAPSVLDIAPSPSGGGLPNLVGNSNAPKPVLQTLNVSQGVSQGLLIKKVQPTYPTTAMRMHVEGAVQLTATIGKDGSITAVKVTSGEPLLSKAALDAVKQWKYKPYYLNGEPVEIQTQITVNFKLPR